MREYVTVSNTGYHQLLRANQRPRLDHGLRLEGRLYVYRRRRHWKWWEHRRRKYVFGPDDHYRRASGYLRRHERRLGDCNRSGRDYLVPDPTVAAILATAAASHLSFVRRQTLEEAHPILPGTTAHASLFVAGSISSDMGCIRCSRNASSWSSGSVSASASTPASKYSEFSKRL